MVLARPEAPARLKAKSKAQVPGRGYYLMGLLLQDTTPKMITILILKPAGGSAKSFSLTHRHLTRLSRRLRTWPRLRLRLLTSLKR
jgi:hypothetical protein